MNKILSEIIDFLRFPLALVVVILHLPGNYTNWSTYTIDDVLKFSIYDHLALITNIIGQIAVPMFFCISGYLFRCDNYPEYKLNIKKRTKSVLIPYFIWNFITLLIMILVKLLGVYVNNKDINGLIEYLSFTNLVKYFFGNYDNLYIWQPIDAPLWFIRDLYIMFIVSPIIIYLIKHITSVH